MIFADICYAFDVLKVFASKVDKMTTEINRNMLCQFRILLLTQKFNFSILNSLREQVLINAIGVNNASNYGRFAL